MAVVSVAVFVLMPYQREQRIAWRIEALGGTTQWKYSGPNWIPQSMRVRLPVLRSLYRVNLWKPVPPNMLSDLRPITSLNQLHLYGEGAGDDGRRIGTTEGDDQLRMISRFGRDSMICFTPASVILVRVRSSLVRFFNSLASFNPTSVIPVKCRLSVVRFVRSQSSFKPVSVI